MKITKTTTDGHIWELIEHSEAGAEEHEVWKDASGLLWTDKLPGTYTFDEAQEVASKIILLDKKWHVPTYKEWLQAEIFDVREVLPNMNHWFWSSSPYGLEYARYFSGDVGVTDYGLRYFRHSVRCAGR